MNESFRVRALCGFFVDGREIEPGGHIGLSDPALIRALLASNKAVLAVSDSMRRFADVSPRPMLGHKERLERACLEYRRTVLGI